MVATKARAGIRQGPGHSVFVFEFVTESAPCPASFGVVALILETRAVVVVHIMELKILVDRSEHWVDNEAVTLIDVVPVGAMQQVFESAQPVLPARRPGQRKLQAAQKIVL